MEELEQILNDLKLKYPDIKILYQEDLIGNEITLFIKKDEKIAKGHLSTFDMMYLNSYELKIQLLSNIIDDIDWGQLYYNHKANHILKMDN